MLLLAACVTGGPLDSSGDTGEPVPTVTFGNANNYSFEGTLHVPSFPVHEQADVDLAWDTLTHDLQCHTLDPVADIDNVGLMVFPYLDHAEVEAGLARDSLQQVDMGAYIFYEPGDATEASLSQLTFYGTDPEIEAQFREGSGTWLVMLTTGTDVGIGTRSLAFLEPRADSDVDAVALSGGCDLLEHTVSLRELTPLPIARTGPWLLDWSRLTATGLGTPLLPTKVTSVMVAHFAQGDLAALEDQFLDLTTVATRTWSVPHPAGTTDRLDALVATDDGSPFPGFDAEGTWLLALFCDSCPVPAPLALTVLAPEG